MPPALLLASLIWYCLLVIFILGKRMTCCFCTLVAMAHTDLLVILLLSSSRHTASAWAPFKKPCLLACLLSCFSSIWLFETPMDYIAPQAPPSMEFSRQEYWSGLPCPPPGDLSNPGIELRSLASPASADGFFTPSVSWLTDQWGSPSALCSWEQQTGCTSHLCAQAALLAPKLPHVEPLARGSGCLFLKIKRQRNPAWRLRTNAGVASKLNIFQQNLSQDQRHFHQACSKLGFGKCALSQTISTSRHAPHLWHLMLRRQEIRLPGGVGLLVQGSEVNVVALSCLHLTEGKGLLQKTHETDPCAPPAIWCCVFMPLPS